MSIWRRVLLGAAGGALLMSMAGAAAAEDTSALKPPAGAKVAIIAFEDLQCSDCADAEPLLQEAVKKYGVPLVRHDFSLPQHNWSFEAHVLARYFDTLSPALGEQFRHWIFTIQTSIRRENLRGMAERFADQHRVVLPEEIDPDGKLAALVKADFALGQAAGVQKTPTVWVVSQTERSEPFIEQMRKD